MVNKYEVIEYIMSSNTGIQALKKMEIKWISWGAILKEEEELATLVVEFSASEYANVAMDYNILIGQKIYWGVVYNRKYKSIQCF